MREKMDKRMRVLAALAGNYCGQAQEDQLPRASLTFLREMWAEGLIEGVGYPDARWESRASRETRAWWITEKGRGVLRAWEEGLERMRRHGERYGEKGEMTWDLGRAPVGPDAATARGPLPRVVGHIPEIVVTPTPAPESDDERD